MSFRLHNKWPGGPVNFDFSSLPPEFDEVEAMLPLPLCLDPQVGTESVLLWFDRTEFIHQLAATQPFNLMMKSGVVRTDYGPLMFLVFWVPNPKDPLEPMSIVDCHLNPLNAQSLAIWRDLARQSHWHLFLLDGYNEQQGFFEFENGYGLGEALDAAEDACKEMESSDFNLAKAQFCRNFNLPDLLHL
jgi:hypothetical protein